MVANIEQDKQIVELYKSGQSASRVSVMLGISMWTVYKRMKKLGIARRSSATTNSIIFQASPKSYPKIESFTPSRQKLWQAGLLSYLGEGSKRNNSTVDLAN
jgi:hypothetical protein